MGDTNLSTSPVFSPFFLPSFRLSRCARFRLHCSKRLHHPPTPFHPPHPPSSPDYVIRHLEKSRSGEQLDCEVLNTCSCLDFYGDFLSRLSLFFFILSACLSASRTGIQCVCLYLSINLFIYHIFSSITMFFFICTYLSVYPGCFCALYSRPGPCEFL